MNVGGTRSRALLLEDVPVLDHQRLAAGAGAVHDADLLAVGVGDLEAGVGDRLLGGGDAEPHGAARCGGRPWGPSTSVASKSRTSPADLCVVGRRCRTW